MHHETWVLHPELPPHGTDTDLEQLPPHSLDPPVQSRVRNHAGNPHLSPVLLSFLLKLPEGGAVWLRRPRCVLSHKGQAKGCHYARPLPGLRGSRPVPPTHFIFFYSQPRSRSQTGQRTCPARHGTAHSYYLGGRGKRIPRSNHM